MWGRVAGVPFICKATAAFSQHRSGPLAWQQDLSSGCTELRRWRPLEAALGTTLHGRLLNWSPGVALRLCSGISKRCRRMWTYFLEDFCALQLWHATFLWFFSRPEIPRGGTILNQQL